MIANVLSQRYSTKEINSIWSPEGKIKLERELWVAILKAQSDLGLNIKKDAINAYESVIDNIDVDSINSRERITKHDVKARIEEFCELAGYEEIHKGMTSRDLTENVEQLQVYRSLKVIQSKSIALLNLFAKKADEYKDLFITGKTHNVAAQITTFGKRIAMFGEEFLESTNRLNFLIDNYSIRGIKGAIGTQLDMLNLFEGNHDKAIQLEQKISSYLGISNVLTNVGQVYPRSMDFEVISTLVNLSSSPSSFAKTLRIMAGHEFISEGFAKGQVGSSAMPHKMNSRSAERINGLKVILSGYLTMASSLSGDQWNEGDVSCSVVRRVMLPDSFFTIDGIIETTLVILNQMNLYPAMIQKENNHYLPYLLTTTILMILVKGGMGREEAHEIIKESSVSSVNSYRNGDKDYKSVMDKLADNDKINLSKDQINEILEQGIKNVGLANSQVNSFIDKASQITKEFPKSLNYEPESIL